MEIGGFMNITNDDVTIINNIKYVNENLCAKYLNISQYYFEMTVKNNSIKTIEVNSNYYIELSSLIKLYEIQKEFLSKHITNKKVKEKYKKYIYNDLRKIKIPFCSRTDGSEIAYRLIDINEELENERENLKNYMSREEVLKVLCICDYNLRKTIQQFEIKKKRFGKVVMYWKDDIDFLKEQQKELGIRYISFDQVKNTYGKSVFRHINSYKLPIFARRLDIFPSLSATYYDKVEIESFVAKKSKVEKYHNVEEDTLFDTFKKKVEIRINFKSLPNLEYTYSKWIDYVNNTLSKTKRNNQGKIYLINYLVHSTQILDDYLYENNTQEIYTLSTTKLVYLINITRAQSLEQVAIIYGFLKFISRDTNIRIKASNQKKQFFNINDIKNPSTEYKKNKDKKAKHEIYSFNQYKSLFDFINDKKYHIDKYFTLSIKNKGIYLSSWLYVILHLNNAWRNGDIITFPRLNFDSLELQYGITNIDWFKTNNISFALSKQIMTLINHYEFKVNKTQVNAHFFCSNQLMDTLATILLMLDLHIKYEYVGEKKEFNKPVMMFYNKYNSISKFRANNFIKCANIDNFDFSSLKMNKTILTYIYKLSDEKGSLLLSKYLRAHTNEKSTLHYVNIDKNEIDFLVEQLFARGEFGYIYDTLLDIIDKKNIKLLEEKTKKILQIKNFFGNELKIEATLSMINYFYDERKEVLELLTNKSYDECLTLLSDIYMNNLPSRKNNIQCLHSKNGCVCIEVNNCVDCKYSIPSIYALNAICDSVKSDLKIYNNTSKIPQKIKTSLLLMKKKQLLKEAIKRYGKDYIYSILEMTSEEFLDIFSRILPPEELSKKLNMEGC